MDSILSYAKKLLDEVIEKGDIVVDATVGNGYDTSFLAEKVGHEGTVYGFDVQHTAIVATKKRLNEQGTLGQVRLFQESHANVRAAIQESEHGNIKAAIFNLGYLPGSDKQVITQANSTIAAVKSMLNMMVVGGRIVLVVYHGHEGGREEKEALLNYVSNLDQKQAQVLHYQFINQKNEPPFIIAIEKRIDA